MSTIEAEAWRRALAIADRQRGHITQVQLIRCGFTHQAIKRHRRLGLLRSVHRGVYLVGHAASVPYGRETAALLSCGDDAALAGRSALGAWHALKPFGNHPVEITVRRELDSRRGITVHRAHAQLDCDIGRAQGLPATKPARALLEFAASATTREDVSELESAVREAIALKLVDRPALLAVIARYPGHRGTARLRELADPKRASEITDSEAEEQLSRLLRKADAPPSQTQFWIGRYRADRCWPELKVVVEVDGVKFHRDGQRMEADNRRTDALRPLGYVVIRFTRRQIVQEPEYVLMTIGRALGAAQERLLRAA